MDLRVISIGSISSHELWNERTAMRAAHATTTLIRSDDRVILVDPGLPEQVLVARLHERSGLDPSAITDIFLTNFRPSHRRGISVFQKAQWYISETERETVGAFLTQNLHQDPPPEAQAILEQELTILKRCRTAPDRLASQVDLFPLPGYSPGTCGLLLSHSRSTTLVAGDAVATSEHLEQGRVLKGCFDAEKARESFLEAIEIADTLIPGHDNLLPNPGRRMV